ncbi:MAG: aminomethyltransferase family protein [Myxococcaceae bacterium]|nr:aminomethyltransferase family protein [Myxococcaceae bacterium]
MPRPTPFHERLAKLNEAYAWKEWSGYYAACRYETNHIYEYTAFRRSAGLLDVSPLFKYEVRGPDAARFLAYVTVRDATKLKVDRVGYCCWCDERGKIIDDGTLTRLGDEHFLLTAAEPTWRWLSHLARGFDVKLDDVSDRIAVLALQGPKSRDVLKACVQGIDFETLTFFGSANGRLGAAPVRVSRTGYTGDLGYEIWCDNAHALPVFDAITEAGRAYALRVCGLDALDMTRVEAGFILLGVDYFSAPHCVRDERRSTPFEVGLGFTVQLGREPFMGSAALEAEKKAGPKWELVGLETDWEDLERLYDAYGLPPSLPGQASRVAVPVYLEGHRVGQATSHTWSPMLKRFISLATVRADVAKPGTELKVEHTVEYDRRAVKARVVQKPFYDPEHKRKP